MKKRADGRFVKTVMHEGKRIFLYGDSQSEVDDKYLEFKLKQKKGLAINDKTTMGELAIQWYDTYIRNNKDKALKTKEMYEYIVNAHISVFSNYKLKDIKPIMIEKYLKGLGKSKSLEHKIKITFGQIFKVAKANKLIDDNPMEYVHSVTQDEPKREFLEEVERDIVIQAVLSNPRMFKLIKVLLYTGMRLGEALALTWKDLDERNKTISITKAVEFEGNKTNIKGPKTISGNRKIPVPQEIVDMLIQDKGSSLYVFPQVNGKMHSQSSIYSMWRRAQSRVDNYIERQNKSKPENEKQEEIHITFRTMRHTYATGLYDAGVDIKYAQYLLGHADAQITMNIYTHISKYRQINNSFKIENLYRKTEKEPDSAANNG